MLTDVARKAIKTAVLPAGPFVRRRAGDLVVLLYHRIADHGREIDLPASVFDRQLATLASSDRVVTLDDGLARLAARSPGGVVVSFDDGTADFYEEALPLLTRYRLPAILYLATGAVVEASDGCAIGWAQLRDAVNTGFVSIGAHTHSHADLSRATEEEARREMERSKAMIEDRLGVACRHFAYPWGVASPGADRAARSIFDSAALGWGTNRSGRTDFHRLDRTPVLRNDTALFFRAKTKGLLDGEAVAYRAMRRGPWRRS